MFITYNGGPDAMEIPLFPGEVVVERGGTVEVPDELGVLLIQQPDYEEVKRKRPPKSETAEGGED